MEYLESLLECGRVGEDSLWFVAIWAFCHDAIDRLVDFIYVTYWGHVPLAMRKKCIGVGVFYCGPCD